MIQKSLLDKIDRLEGNIKKVFDVLNDCRDALIMLSLIDKSSLSKDTLKKVEEIFDKNVSYKKYKN